MIFSSNQVNLIDKCNIIIGNLALDYIKRVYIRIFFSLWKKMNFLNACFWGVESESEFRLWRSYPENFHFYRPKSFWPTLSLYSSLHFSLKTVKCSVNYLPSPGKLRNSGKTDITKAIPNWREPYTIFAHLSYFTMETPPFINVIKKWYGEYKVFWYKLNPRTTLSQDVQKWFPVQLAFAKFLSRIKGNFWGSAVSMILALY